VGEPNQGQQVCPRCKLISPSTATTCDCGYDFRVSWAEQTDEIRQKPVWPRTRTVGVFLICAAVLAATMFLTRGVPDFIGGSGWGRGFAEVVLAWGTAVLLFALGLVLMLISFAKSRGR
jgi:hypothetical protein